MTDNLRDSIWSASTANVSSSTRTDQTPAIRVLVVDDSPDSAESLAVLLQYLGYDVRTALDGLEALSTAEEFKPDLMLLDIGLPKLNGYEVAKRVRAQPYGAKMKIVALTGWGQDEDIRRSMEAGFDRHLVKPVNVADLRELMPQPSADHPHSDR
jgi:CheY-like chemotaxis protein